MPGVGPILANKAVGARQASGGFATVEAFGEAIGLKPHMVERIRPLVVVGPIKSHTLSPQAGRIVDF